MSTLVFFLSSCKGLDNLHYRYILSRLIGLGELKLQAVHVAVLAFAVIG